jgi:ornithine carbamoyltransferase
MIADLMTVQEQKGKELAGKKIVYVGDGRNNVCNSIMVSTVKLGMHFTCLAPKDLQPAKELVKQVNAIALKSGGKISIHTIEDKKKALKDADVIYTDV